MNYVLFLYYLPQGWQIFLQLLEKHSLCTLAHVLLASKAWQSRNYFYTHSALSKTVSVSYSLKASEPGLEPRFENSGSRALTQFPPSAILSSFWWWVGPLAEASVHWLSLSNLLSSLSNTSSFPGGEGRRERQRAARLAMANVPPALAAIQNLQVAPSQGRAGGSAAARMERLQSSSRVGWSITYTNSRFSLGGTSWQELGAGAADTLGESTRFFLLAWVTSCTHQEPHRWRQTVTPLATP